MAKNSVVPIRWNAFGPVGVGRALGFVARGEPSGEPIIVIPIKNS